MSQKIETKYLGMTPKQAVLIGVLLAILAGVLMFGQGAEDSAATTPETASAPQTVVSESRTAAAATTATVHKTKWPEFPFEEMLKHNPFQHTVAVSEPAPEPTIEVAASEPEPIATPDPQLIAREAERRQKLASALSDLQSQKVKVILRTNGRVSAVIGDRLIHEGDLIDGVRVVSIQPNGVIVAPEETN